jgi:S-adenosylmethionine:tRNA ribosyltransferase-isomerase
MTTALRVEGISPGAPVGSNTLDFELPDSLVAHEPPEARGLARDGVRMLVTGPGARDVRHATARDLPEFLRAGDVLVVNASATISAALDGWRSLPGGRDELIALQLSSPVPYADDDRRWVIELRRPTPDGTRPLWDARSGERIHLRGGGTATLVRAFDGGRPNGLPNGFIRLWEAELSCSEGVVAYATRFGTPIRYGYVRKEWPLAAYQTIFAAEPGSAEMPSAGRPFTAEVVRRLERRGVAVVPIVLHTGVASLESGEPPYPERFRVSREAARAVNDARTRGGRVVTAGTTVVRALESVAADDGTLRAGAGWTDLVITPDRGVRIVDALVTGFHEPRASHLAMLEAVAGRAHLAAAYQAALENSYLWHEFGDIHLIIRE